MRFVEGLHWARPCDRPPSIPITRPRGAKANGLRYEKALAANLLGVGRRGQWFSFADRHGPGYCQVDILLSSLDTTPDVGILEAKYTWTPDGHAQLHHLYIPVVGEAYSRSCWGVVVAKKLTPQIPSHYRVVGELYEAIELARAHENVVLHWLGKSALRPQRPPKSLVGAVYKVSPRPVPATIAS